MDIEGAEYSILGDEKILKELENQSVKVIVAFHPSFTRKYLKISNKYLFLRLLARILSLYDNAKIARLLFKYSKIKRTNDVQVRSKLVFSILLSLGVYEYILDFGN